MNEKSLNKKWFKKMGIRDACVFAFIEIKNEEKAPVSRLFIVAILL
jgi:hypothetical protein